MVIEEVFALCDSWHPGSNVANDRRAADSGPMTGETGSVVYLWAGHQGCDGFRLLGDPFTMPADMYLHRFYEDWPNIPVMGGMASGGMDGGGIRNAGTLTLTNSALSENSLVFGFFGGDRPGRRL